MWVFVVFEGIVVFLFSNSKILKKEQVSKNKRNKIYFNKEKNGRGR